MAQQDSILIVAGEASADVYGAQLVRVLRGQSPDLRLWGVGGKAMQEQGFEADIDAHTFSTAGLTEVLTSLPRLWKALRRLSQLAAKRRPKVAVLLDLPDFNLRLAARLKSLGIVVIYYVSPQLWAWRPKRVEAVRRNVDKMLCILPFEPAFYEKYGVPAEYVGHPMVEEFPDISTQEEVRAALSLESNEAPVVALLPGSRKKEVERHLPTMLRGMELLQEKHPGLSVLLPVASTLDRSLFSAAVEQSALKIRLLDGHAAQALGAADVAVVCSGTATLQTALLERPMVVVYRVSAITYWLLRRLVRVAHIALVNIIANQRLVAELIQYQMTPQGIARETAALLSDATRRRTLQDELSKIRLTLGQFKPAERVAHIALGYFMPPSHPSDSHP